MATVENRLNRIEGAIGLELARHAAEASRLEAIRRHGVPWELSELTRDDLEKLRQFSLYFDRQGAAAPTPKDVAALGEDDRAEFIRISDLVKASTVKRVALEVKIVEKLGGGMVRAGACAVADLEGILAALEGGGVGGNLIREIQLTRLGFKPATAKG